MFILADNAYRTSSGWAEQARWSRSVRFLRTGPRETTGVSGATLKRLTILTSLEPIRGWTRPGRSDRCDAPPVVGGKSHPASSLMVL